MRQIQVAATGVLIAALAVFLAGCDRASDRAAVPIIDSAGSATAGSATAGSATAGSATAGSATSGSATSVPPSATAQPAVLPSMATISAKANAASTVPSTAGRSTPKAPELRSAPGGKASGTDVLPGTHCQIFPADNFWHADVRSLPISSHSTQWLTAMDTSSRHLHPDFGPAYGAQAVPYGIPVTVVAAGHPRVPVAFDYAAESDRLLYPLGADTQIEGGPSADGDSHAVVVTADSCELFETWNTHATPAGWTAGSGAHWALSSDALRPDGWTSSDAAGLPILPGLLRWDEVAAGHVDHAIRFTTNATDAAHVWPARHDASSQHNAALPPMGARFRLKAGFAISGYGAQTQTVLRAMQTYGLVLADNGSPWFFQGTADNAWPDALISQLKSVPASAFEAVDTAGLVISPNSGVSR